MTKYLFTHRKHLMGLSGFLIVSAFTGHFFFHSVSIAEFFLFIATLIGGLPISIQAYQALKVKVVSIDLLVTIAIFGALWIQNYEESAIVAFLFLFGSYLEQRTLEKTRSAIKELTQIAPETAFKKINNQTFSEVDIDEVEVGDTLLVKTGGKVPVDGVIIVGEGHLNEASITGEAFPVTKKVNHSVFAGTILENGTLQVRAEKVGEETTFGKIIELIEEAQDSKSETERVIDHFARYYTPFILVLAIFIGFLTKDVALAVTILVLGCPGALVIGVPISTVAGIGNGARNGILLKGSETITRLQQVDTMIFDKTGTLTVGNPYVTKKISIPSTPTDAESYLASIEQESDHPLAKAIVEYLSEVSLVEVTSTQVCNGGIIAQVAEKQVIVGNQQLLEQNKIQLPAQIIQEITLLEQQGHSIVLTAINGQFALLLGIRDQIRQGMKQDLQALKQLGIKHLIILSGDNQGMVEQVASELSLTEAHGQMLPNEKANYVKKLQADGRKVAFVGDGINDSPSIALADIGIAMGNGTDVAIETSDVVLMNSDFHRLPHALGLAKATTQNMSQNIVIALLVVLTLLFSIFFSDWMNMAIGMLVHEGSILVVILNGMRLLQFSLNK